MYSVSLDLMLNIRNSYVDMSYSRLRSLLEIQISPVFNYVNSSTPSYSISGAKIDQAPTEKDLGVHVSCNLFWNIPVNNIVNKANRMVGLVYRTCSNYCDQLTMLMLYKAFFRPQLEYATLSLVSTH